MLYVADRLPWINRFTAKIKSPQIQVLLVLTASVGLVSTPIGGLINKATTGINGILQSTVGHWTGVGIVSALALVALLMLISDFVSGVKPRTLLLAAFTPALLVMVPGPIGSGAASTLGFVVTQVGSLVVWLMGG